MFIYASNQVKIMLFFGCVYSFHPQNSLVLSFYPQNFSSFATNPPNIHIHGMSIHYGIEIASACVRNEARAVNDIMREVIELFRNRLEVF